MFVAACITIVAAILIYMGLDTLARHHTKD